jgi:hypothetical protein
MRRGPIGGATNNDSNRFCQRCGRLLAVIVDGSAQPRAKKGTPPSLSQLAALLLTLVLFVVGLASVAMALADERDPAQALRVLLDRSRSITMGSPPPIAGASFTPKPTLAQTARQASTPTRASTLTPTRIGTARPRPSSTATQTPSSSTLIKGPGKPVYLLTGRTRHWIPNSQTFEAMGYRWEDVTEIGWQELLAYSVGEPLPVVAWKIEDGALLKGTSPDVYLMEGQQKRLIANWPVFLAHGYQEVDIAHVTDGWLASIADGPTLAE